MNIVKEIVKQINQIIYCLVETGICDKFNSPSVQKSGKQTIISWSGYTDLSICLKNVDYDVIYDELNNNNQFSLKLVDGMLIHLLYTIEDDVIVSHRLASFPSRKLELFENDPEMYETDCIYSDIISKSVVSFPIRFDYNRNQIPNHPRSHLTLGQFKNCRIPVYGPLCPNVFMNFILQNFYNSFFMQNIGDKFKNSIINELTITSQETECLHINICQSS